MAVLWVAATARIVRFIFIVYNFTYHFLFLLNKTNTYLPYVTLQHLGGGTSSEISCYWDLHLRNLECNGEQKMEAVCDDAEFAVVDEKDT